MNFHFLKPMLDRPRDELGAIVAANASRNTTHREQLRQRVDHILAGKAPIHPERQTFAGTNDSHLLLGHLLFDATRSRLRRLLAAYVFASDGFWGLGNSGFLKLAFVCVCEMPTDFGG